jgi:hypothetical protein
VLQQAPALDVVEAAHAALESLPRDCASEAERLIALCEKLAEVSASLSAWPRVVAVIWKG